MVQTKIYEHIPGIPAHKKHGFRLDKVPKTKCLICLEPIGDEEYLLDTWLARFGMMFFVHKECVIKEEGLSVKDYENP